MEEENDSVTLHGMWISTYAKKVELALKIKGIAFDYVEEDLSNKSSPLLKYNPIYKKVPLLHRGKPLSESLVILEYIDETWNNLQPLLLPENPYERATVRLWASYCLQISDTMKKAFISARDVEGGAFDELFEILKVMEEGMKDFFPGGRSKICAENLGLLDIIIVCSLATYKAAEEVVGMKILDPEKNPFVYSWVTTLLELPLVKETLPPHDKLVSRLEFIKKNGFRFQSNI